MVCGEADGWGCDGSAVVSRGARKVMTQFLRALRIKVHILFVNRPAATVYGSTSMDCRHVMRHGVDRLAGLRHHACAAAGRDAPDGRGFTVAQRG